MSERSAVKEPRSKPFLTDVHTLRERARQHLSKRAVTQKIDRPALPPTVMPAKAGIHDFLCCDEGKPWLPACAGITVRASR